jgi:hypothetical protein
VPKLRTCVGHGQQARCCVLVDEVLVLKLLSVNALATGSIAVREIASLAHEGFDDTVELATLQGQKFSTSTHSILRNKNLYTLRHCPQPMASADGLRTKIIT